MSIAKSSVNEILIPIIELFGKEGDELTGTIKKKREKLSNNIMKQELSSVSIKLVVLLNQFYHLLQYQKASDEILIQACFMCISGFFMDATTYKSFEVDKLQLECMHLLRYIFSEYPLHRQFIMDDNFKSSLLSWT